MGSGESNCVKYVRVILDLLGRVFFHVNMLIYSLRVYLILRIYNIATLRSIIPSDPRERDCLPDTGTLKPAQGEYFVFPIFCHTPSNNAVEGVCHR